MDLHHFQIYGPNVVRNPPFWIFYIFLRIVCNLYRYFLSLTRSSVKKKIHSFSGAKWDRKDRQGGRDSIANEREGMEKGEREVLDGGCKWFTPPLFPPSEMLFANIPTVPSGPSWLVPHHRAHVHRCVGNPGISRCCRFARQFRQSRAGDRFYDPSSIGDDRKYIRTSRESASKYQSSNCSSPLLDQFPLSFFFFFLVKLTKSLWLLTFRLLLLCISFEEHLLVRGESWITLRLCKICSFNFKNVKLKNWS